MPTSDFIRSNVVTIKKLEKGMVEAKNNLQPYEIFFTREIYSCPNCGSASFTQKRESSCHIFAIMDDKPSDCKLIRTEYNCNNSNCPSKHCFYNTNGHEDSYFQDTSSFSQRFIHYTLTSWLKKKNLSFDAIGAEYGISGNTVDKWSLLLRQKFEKSFDVEAKETMVYRSFIDKNGIMRGFVGSPYGSVFRILSFIDDYSTEGLMSFLDRVKSQTYTSMVYYDGDDNIGFLLGTMHHAEAKPIMKVDPKKNNLLRANQLLYDIVQRVKHKDSYDSIVIKYLYDTPECKTRINEVLTETVEKEYGIKKPDNENKQSEMWFGYITSGRYTLEQPKEIDLYQHFEELPRISGYYAVY